MTLYNFDIIIFIIPDDKDDEESENDTDVFANSTQSTHVAKSNHCDDDTSIQSSIGKYQYDWRYSNLLIKLKFLVL